MARHTSYRPSYADALREAAGEGLSLTTAAGRIGVHRDTLHHWTRQFPEFAAAMGEAKAIRTAWLERRLLEERGSAARLGALILALFNSAPEEWTRKRK